MYLDDSSPMFRQIRNEDDVDLAIHGFEGIHGVAFVGESRRVGFPKEGVGDGRAIMVSSAVA